MEYTITLFLLIFAHCLADYPLQGEYMAIAKNRHTPTGKQVWPLVLSSHAIIHGGMVLIVTGSVVLGLLEVIAHAAIDYLKCEGTIGYYSDQFLHIMCKIVWVTIFVTMM